ncbi:RNA chaperone Hfq [Bacillus cereus]|uniref:RNA chaperone Hfq n=1 Tax=Bacillus TaxID=1386 RepID=UPI000BEE64D3|nr:RNA chaperone Hfq [Bacillus cereus]MEE3960130.1 RNA chaperone Hfq [Bacillus thuringiensis]MRC18802.1 RNA chaperone Hfq [Bacillus thuringiensis]PDY15351.1 RNA chaperone Hfq [Bacillus cereus]PEC80943.1 RNA chaperone Hfq [Bacillus cereus]PET65322.1 RNA chaperone Hfq [Bacillus cereus]
MKMIQEDMYKELIDKKRTVTIFLKSGVPIRGQILSIDTYSVLVMAQNKQKLIYKQAISTITK